MRGLKAPPRRSLAPAAATASAVSHDLLFAFDGAGAGHDDEFVAANFAVPFTLIRVLLLAEFLADELVGSGDAHGVFDLRQWLRRIRGRP